MVMKMFGPLGEEDMTISCFPVEGEKNGSGNRSGSHGDSFMGRQGGSDFIFKIHK
jgi:hypothetical protein